MSSLPPWADGPFELMVHAESHLKEAKDFDRRIALISFDNAIEVAISTYLTLNPIQRGGREYSNTDVNNWIRNYHTKLDFFGSVIASRNIEWSVEKSYIIWVHDQRNEQYHGGRKGVPEMRTLQIARTAALWIFSTLFDVSDAEAALQQAVVNQAPPDPPSKERNLDLAIDGEYGIIAVGEQDYYASELLFAVDHAAYLDLGGKLIDDAVAETVDDEL